MEKFNAKKSTLSIYVKNEDQIMQAYDGDMFGDQRKRLRKAAHPKLEEALLRWIAVLRVLPLSGPFICAQAEKFVVTMNIDSFNASEGWFDRFKKRHVMVFRNVCGERGAVDKSVVQDWRSRLAARFCTYELCNIFNADETTLFYKALPDKTIAFKGDPCIGAKRSKERVTVLLAANMTGIERLPLLVIGKAAKPRCFKNIKQLPVDYRFNKKA
nr:tigger transposable element-derived protein 4-like [Rhipicephalus microplus]